MSVDLTGLTGNDNFDASKIDPNLADFSPLPEGSYPSIAVGSEMKESSKNSANKYLNWKYQVIDGPYKGRTFYEIMNLGHSDEDTRKRAQSQLSSLCRAVGVMQVRNSAELYNRPFVAELGVEERSDKKGSYNNKVKKHHPIGGNGNPVLNNPAPVAGAPAQTTPAAGGAFQAGAAVPWKK